MTKSFGLSDLAVGNRTTVIVLTVIIFISGLVGYLSMPREAFPEIVFPEIYVGTPYPGNSPKDIEKLITKPLEKEINTITGIDKILSTSVDGYSSIDVKFGFDVNPTEALRKVKDAVDKVKADPNFPTDLPADPNVFEMNFSELMPVMNINLSGDFSNDILKDYAEQLKDKLENLQEVSKVEIRGIAEKEVKIEIDAGRLEMLEISFRDVENAVSSENMSISGGDVIAGGVRRSIQVKGEFESIEEIKNIIVKQEKFDIVYLRDIAQVSFAEKDAESYAREFEQPVLMLDVFKRSGENLLELSDNVNVLLNEMKETEFPASLSTSITSDMSEQTRMQVSELENSIILGMILVVGVLLFFLGLRNATFVGLAIPLSMFISFVWLNAMGVTLNMMVLFSLVLALGMLVDNGIVIVENIYRLMDEGKSPIEAAKQGAGEVAWPIIASTATTLAAFVPLALWPGQMGEFMKFLPMTLMIVLGSSLFVALVINPVITAIWMKIGNEKISAKKTWKTAGIMLGIGLVFSLFSPEMMSSVFGVSVEVSVQNGNTGVSTSFLPTIGHLLIIIAFISVLNAFVLLPMATKFQSNALPKLENAYENFLKFAIRDKNPLVFLFGTFALLIVSIMLLGVFMPKVEFFPANEPKYVNIFIEEPIGTDIEVTNEATKEVESRLDQFFFHQSHWMENDSVRYDHLVESIIAQVGKGTSDPAQGPSFGNTPHKARVMVSFVPFQKRQGINTSKVMAEIHGLVQDIPGVVISVGKDESGPPMGKPINIEIRGEDYDLLLSEAERMRGFINEARIYGIEELKTDVELGKPELMVYIDRDKARRLNISTAQIGMTLRTALFGKEVSKFKYKDDDYPIMVRLDEQSRFNVEKILNTRITFRDQTNGQIRQIPISSVVSSEKSSTFSAVKRRNLERLVTLQSNVLEGENANLIVEQIKSVLENYDTPQGVEVKFTGQQEEQAKEMSFLSVALLIAVFLIFLIIVAQFNSVSGPFIILSAVLFSLIGVFLGMVIFQMDFVIIMTMIGLISLAGIVVNNAIVLLDYTKLLMARRKEELGIAEDERLSMDEIYKAVVEGGKTRLRPVLLTAITTILGLLPMAYGLNINFISFLAEWDPQIYIGGDNVVFWGPMSKTIIYGLTFATFLTLVIVPVLFVITEKIKNKVGGA